MKKKIIFSLCFLITILFCYGCVSSTDSAIPKTQILDTKEFDALLEQQPLCVTKTKYVVQDTEYKTLFPDMLHAQLKNNTNQDIKNAVIAFVAWDENGLPVKIEGQFDFSPDYLKKVNYDDINLAAGQTFNENVGFALSSTCNIKTFKAVAFSFETFDGQTWENPYFKEFCDLYEEKKYSNDSTIEISLEENVFQSDANFSYSSTNLSDSDTIDEETFQNSLKAEPVHITKTKYIVQDEAHKALFPDMLQVIIQNNSQDDIKNAVIAFVAWDENGLPVKIEGQFDFGSGSYIKEVHYTDINLAAGKNFGKDYGYNLSETCSIKTFKAIVVSYETFDGKTWENPHYDQFKTLYEGKKLK